MDRFPSAVVSLFSCGTIENSVLYVPYSSGVQLTRSASRLEPCHFSSSAPHIFGLLHTDKFSLCCHIEIGGAHRCCSSSGIVSLDYGAEQLCCPFKALGRLAALCWPLHATEESVDTFLKRNSDIIVIMLIPHPNKELRICRSQRKIFVR
jgi:hypothetical protein